MLVVSNIDLRTKQPTIKPIAFLRSSVKDSILNVNNDYRYLKTAYYVSMHAEVLGNAVVPTSESIIAVNRTPILLLKASRVGIPTMPYLVTSSVTQILEETAFPLIVFAVNPFSYDGYKVAKNKSALYRAVKSLGMNYKFAVCAQPLRGEMVSFKSIFGKCQLEGAVKTIAEKVYDAFKIPVCKLHVQVVADKAYLCGLQPLKKEEMMSTDLEVISEEISLLSSKGEPVVG